VRAEARTTYRLCSNAPVTHALFGIALACQGGLDALLLTRFQIESVALHFLNNVLLQTLRLKRLSAFSRVSASWMWTSAKGYLLLLGNDRTLQLRNFGVLLNGSNSELQD
jgi:hypothetical protein